MSDVQAPWFPEDDVCQEQLKIDYCKRREHVRACIHELAKVVTKLYNSDKERLAKKVVDLWYAESFQLNWIQVTMKDVHACLLFLRGMSDESFKKRF